MHPQLDILLQIQDLKAQRRDLAEADHERQVEEQEFRIDPDEAVRQIDEKIAELEAELAPPVRARYERVLKGRGRAVVPVINGICYGCFVSIPTALASDIRRNDEIHHCDHCGRFIYVTS
ncbi:MAG TPA: C4-type zinc ribbon domain-containing protein [Longimicrobiales bacterium]